MLVASIHVKYFQVFHIYVCKRFIWVLHIFAMVFKCFQTFWQVFHMLVSSVSSVFFCMLQLLHLDVSKVDQVLHMGCAWKATGGVTFGVTWARCCGARS
jgi:hypothetical protein